MYYEMLELVGFQTMVILDPNGMTFDAVCAFGLVFQLFIVKSGSSYCATSPIRILSDEQTVADSQTIWFL